MSNPNERQLYTRSCLTPMARSETPNQDADNTGIQTKTKCSSSGLPRKRQQQSKSSNTKNARQRTSNGSQKQNDPTAMISKLWQQERHNTNRNDILSFFGLFPHHDCLDNHTSPDLFAIKATTDKDTFYYHELHKQRNIKEFHEAMNKEISQQLKINTYSLRKRSSLSKHCRILPSVWQLRQKCDLKTGKIKRHKARLVIDGSKQRYGLNFDQTYAPVALWSSICLFIAISLSLNWKMRQLNYVLAYPQAPAERQLYMCVPPQYPLPEGDKPSDYALEIHLTI